MHGLNRYCRIELKQSLQYTGRSPRGTKGTIVSTPHWAHTTGCISLGPPPYPRCWLLRALRHSGQRLGSFVYPREEKNSCSPLVNVNGELHSTHVRLLSAKAIRITSDIVESAQSRSSLANHRDTLTCTSLYYTITQSPFVTPGFILVGVNSESVVSGLLNSTLPLAEECRSSATFQ